MVFEISTGRISIVEIRRRQRLRTGTLDVTDDRTSGVVHELDADLGNTTAGTYSKSIYLRSQTIRKPAENAPVRPNTRVTLTSLTGTLADSILWVEDCRTWRQYPVRIRESDTGCDSRYGWTYKIDLKRQRIESGTVDGDFVGR
jgi:hypothetical protein